MVDGSTTDVGMGTSKKSIQVAMLLPGRREPVEWELANEPQAVRSVYSTKDTFCSLYLQGGGRWEWLSEQTGVAIATLKRHYVRYVRTKEDDQAELAKLPRVAAGDRGKNGGSLLHRLLHGGPHPAKKAPVLLER